MSPPMFAALQLICFCMAVSGGILGYLQRKERKQKELADGEEQKEGRLYWAEKAANEKLYELEPQLALDLGYEPPELQRPIAKLIDRTFEEDLNRTFEGQWELNRVLSKQRRLEREAQKGGVFDHLRKEDFKQQMGPGIPQQPWLGGAVGGGAAAGLGRIFGKLGKPF